MAFEASDYHAIEELLTEEEQLVRDTARRFVEEEFQPHLVETYRNGTFPMPARVAQQRAVDPARAAAACGASAVGWGGAAPLPLERACAEADA